MGDPKRIQRIFEKESWEELNKFERIKYPLHYRPDLCAFLYLESILQRYFEEFKESAVLHEEPTALFKNVTRLIYNADSDMIYLNIDCKKLFRIMTKRDVLYLLRCGVDYEDEDSLVLAV